jgi:hypothetical protein
MKNHESITSVFTSGSSIAWFYNIVYILSQSRPTRPLLLPRKRKYFHICIFVFLRQALNELLGVNLTGLYHWFAGVSSCGICCSAVIFDTVNPKPHEGIKIWCEETSYKVNHLKWLAVDSYIIVVKQKGMFAGSLVVWMQRL